MIRAMVLVGITLLYAVLTWQRLDVWTNNLTLWEDAVRVTPCKARPHVNLARAYEVDGRAAWASDEWQTVALLAIDHTCRNR